MNLLLSHHSIKQFRFRMCIFRLLYTLYTHTRTHIQSQSILEIISMISIDDGLILNLVSFFLRWIQIQWQQQKHTSRYTIKSNHGSIEAIPNCRFRQIKRSKWFIFLIYSLYSSLLIPYDVFVCVCLSFVVFADTERLQQKRESFVSS